MSRMLVQEQLASPFSSMFFFFFLIKRTFLLQSCTDNCKFSYSFRGKQIFLISLHFLLPSPQCRYEVFQTLPVFLPFRFFLISCKLSVYFSRVLIAYIFIMVYLWDIFTFLTFFFTTFIKSYIRIFGWGFPFLAFPWQSISRPPPPPPITLRFSPLVTHFVSWLHLGSGQNQLFEAF